MIPAQLEAYRDVAPRGTLELLPVSPNGCRAAASSTSMQAATAAGPRRS